MAAQARVGKMKIYVRNTTRRLMVSVSVNAMRAR